MLSTALLLDTLAAHGWTYRQNRGLVVASKAGVTVEFSATDPVGGFAVWHPGASVQTGPEMPPIVWCLHGLRRELAKLEPTPDPAAA